MRILAVAPYYEPEGGGLERYAHAILSRLVQRGHTVTALAFTRDGLQDGSRDGVRLQRVLPRLRLGNAPIDFGFTARVAQAIRDHRPDVLVAHTPVPFAAEMAYPAAKKAGVPFVVTYHAGRLRGSSLALDSLATLDRLTLERRMLSGAQRLIAVTPYVRDHALRRYRARVAIVPPGVDAVRFQPPRGARGPPDPSILFVGPLAMSYAWKGVDVLWEAFHLLRREIPACTLTLVGDGDRLEEFRARAADDPGIRVAGRLGDAGLVAAMQRAAVVALPSTTDAESFGMVLAEANACGRPVVGSRIGGIPDFVTHGVNGLLATPGDARDLADKLTLLLQDQSLAARLGHDGRRKVLHDHDWGRLASATEAVLEQAVLEKPVTQAARRGPGAATLA